MSTVVNVNGYIKEGGWGANQDPKTWKTLVMVDNKAWFKVVDANKINVATNFPTQDDAQRFINRKLGITFTCVPEGKRWKCTNPTTKRVWLTGEGYRYNGVLAVDSAKPDVIPPVQPIPPIVEPTPTGGIIEDGIKMFYPKIGEAQTFKFGSSNEGRSQYVCKLKKPLINMEITGILDLKKVDNTGEEVSIKTRGGTHSDSNPKAGCCYISGIGYDSTVNNQYECPHPQNHALSLHGKAGKFNPGNIVGKKFGIKNIVYYDPAQDKDVIKVYLDMALDNNWKLFFETTSTQFKNKAFSGSNNVYFRMDDIPGAPESDANAKVTKATVREIKVN